jgi:branched-chain amino acid aminotransferase
VTPPLSSGCLAGVTRLLVLDACRRAGIPYHEKSTPSIWLDRCEEAFLTSSTRDVHPIGTLTGRQLNTVGVVTRKVQQAYFDGIEKMKIVK